MRRLFPLIVAVLLLPEIALAQSGLDGAEHEGFALHHAQAFFADEIGDPLTSIFLNELFGPLFPTVGGGSQATVFSQVIGYFNVIVLVLGGLLFSWNFTAGLLQTAHTGRLLGERWSSLWAPLRVTLAVGLLMPLPYHGGYNAVQAGFAYVVRGATLSASWFWGQAAETILAGQVPIAAAAPQLDPKTARTLYSIAACHHIVQDSLNAAGTTSLWIETPTLEMARINATAQQRAEEFDERHGISSRRDVRAVELVGNGTRRVPICGWWQTPEVTRELAQFLEGTGLKEPARQELLQEFRSGHLAVMSVLYETLRDIVAEKAEVVLGAESQTEPIPNHSAALAAALQEAGRSLTRLSDGLRNFIVERSGGADGRRLALNSITGGPRCQRADLADPAKRGQCFGEGWIGAGRYYVALARINAELTVLTRSQGEARLTGFFAQEEKRSWIGQAASWAGRQLSSDAGDYVDRESSRGQYAAFMKSFENDASRLSAFGFRVDPAHLRLAGDEGGIREAFTEVFGIGLEDAVEAMSLIDPTRDPLVELIGWGELLLTAVGVAMLALLVAPGAAIMLPLIGILWAAGALLQIILPLMPWIIWVLGVTGYFLVVVEAIVGASLWAFAHLRMDGEGLSGNATEGWKLLLVLLLTPILMIFGLLVGMMIFRVTSGLLLSGIFPSAHAALAPASFVAVLLALPAIAILVAFMQLILIERSFSLIAEFPNRVMAWIGGQVDLAVQGASERARMGMIAATATMSRTLPGPGAVTGFRDRVTRLFGRGPGSVRQGRGGGSGGTTRD